MNIKLQYDLHEIGDATKKAIVAIHGWQGDRNSMFPLIKSMNIKNVSWYLLEAPFPVQNGEGFSWSYEKPNGQWEINEPKRLLNDFFSELFNKYDSRKIFVMGFSQGAAVCYELILSFEYPLGGIFPIAGFVRDFIGNKDTTNLDVSPKQIDTKILIGHGKDDDVVPVESSEKTFSLLKAKCRNVELDIYNGKHKINVSY